MQENFFRDYENVLKLIDKVRGDYHHSASFSDALQQWARYGVCI